MLPPTWEEAEKVIVGLSAVLIVAIVGAIAIALFAASPSLTEEQRRFCKYAHICTKYASSRQDCATAGNLEKCIEIKMGGDVHFVAYCTDDGEVKSEVKSNLLKDVTDFTWPSRQACLLGKTFNR
jgi:hypothetical protein